MQTRDDALGLQRCQLLLSLSLFLSPSIIAILIVLPYHLSRLIKLLSQSSGSFSSELHRETITSASRKWIRSWFEWFDIGFLDGKKYRGNVCCVTKRREFYRSKKCEVRKKRKRKKWGRKIPDCRSNIRKFLVPSV